MRDEDLPNARQDDEEDELAAALRGDDDGIRPESPSLKDEIATLIDDGKTYAEAEFAYQKSRLSFAADRSKSVALLIFFALSFVHLALVGIVVGLIIALTPKITPLGATGVVVGALLIGAAIMFLMLRDRAREINEAFKDAE